MHYLSRPWRGGELPRSFKRIEINQQTENLGRHGTPPGSATRVPFYLLQRNFPWEKYVFFRVFYRVYSSMYFLLKDKKLVLVMKL